MSKRQALNVLFGDDYATNQAFAASWARAKRYMERPCQWEYYWLKKRRELIEVAFG